jgi:hypothetical protein
MDIGLEINTRGGYFWRRPIYRGLGLVFRIYPRIIPENDAHKWHWPGSRSRTLLLLLSKFHSLGCSICAFFLCNFCYDIGLSMVDEVTAGFAPASFRRYQNGALGSRQLTVLPNRQCSQRAINNELSG